MAQSITSCIHTTYLTSIFDALRQRQGGKYFMAVAIILSGDAGNVSGERVKYRFARRIYCAFKNFRRCGWFVKAGVTSRAKINIRPHVAATVQRTCRARARAPANPNFIYIRRTVEITLKVFLQFR